MKILKPGKVEQRKFVCPDCGCEFVAFATEAKNLDAGTWEGYDMVQCPQTGCQTYKLLWDEGDPYEEPTPSQTDRERLTNLVREGMPEHSTYSGFADYLIDHGVTFREEWHGEIDEK